LLSDRPFQVVENSAITMRATDGHDHDGVKDMGRAEDAAISLPAMRKKTGKLSEYVRGDELL
jgi:hypothetical protein